MRYKIEEIDKDMRYMGWSVEDNSLEKTIAICNTKAEATLVCEALNKQEAYTLQQMKLPFEKNI